MRIAPAVLLNKWSINAKLRVGTLERLLEVRCEREKDMKVKPTTKASEVVMELGARDEALMEKASTPPSPFQIRNILVPVDFSECSEKALRYAMPLAEQNKAAITLL